MIVHDVRREAAARHLRTAPPGLTRRGDGGAERGDLHLAAGSAGIRCGVRRIAGGIKRGTAYFDLTTNSPTTVRKAHEEYRKKVRICSMRRSAAAHAGRPPASWRSGAAAIRTCSRNGSPCSTRSAIRPATSVRSAPGRSPSWCITVTVTSPPRLRRKCSAWASKPASSRWRSGRQCGRARSAGAALLNSLTDQFLPNKYEPPAFALRLAHKDVSLATALGRELNVPMRLANLALADLSEGLNRGWGDRDSRSMMLCQTERAGIEIKVDPQRLTEALENKTKNG